jgi:8-oxo-dGTP pyrophosphatase MutT (NUDIX family)
MQPEQGIMWRPDVTVAAIAQRDGQFLFVEEMCDAELVINQPAGHVEPNETLIDAVVRETLEETGYHFAPKALIGIYYWPLKASTTTYMRFAFAGDITGHDTRRCLDAGIVRALWMTPAALQAEMNRQRSPLVARCLEDYLAGRRFPLNLVTHLG